MYWIVGLGAFQAIVFAVLLMFKKDHSQSDKFLMGFFFMVALYFLNIYSTQYHLWMSVPEILFGYSLVFLSYGPLLYFYVLSLTGHRITKKMLLLHSIPILAVLLILSPFLFETHELKLQCFTDRFKNLPLYISVGTFLQYLSSPIYFVLIILHLRIHNVRIKNQFSSIEKINLDWMIKLLYGGIGIWFVECLNVIGLNFTEIDFLMTYRTSSYIKIAFIFFVTLMGFYGINQGVVFSKVMLNNEDYKHEKNSDLQNNSSTTNPPTTSSEEKQKLLTYMEDEKPYLNNELRIQDVSNDLNIPIHILSQIINTEIKKNFFDFVNAYRIEEAKKRLVSKEFDHLTIIAIAFDCGFNSKATFNRLFKQYTNSTPSEYKKQNIL